MCKLSTICAMCKLAIFIHGKAVKASCASSQSVSKLALIWKLTNASVRKPDAKTSAVDTGVSCLSKLGVLYLQKTMLFQLSQRKYHLNARP